MKYIHQDKVLPRVERFKTEAQQQRDWEHMVNLAALLKPVKFRKQEIKLALHKGFDTKANKAQAWVYQGLAVHRSYHTMDKNPTYQLTHVGSGLNFGLSFATLYRAKIALVQFVALLGDCSLLTSEQVVRTHGVKDLAILIRRDGVYGMDPCGLEEYARQGAVEPRSSC